MEWFIELPETARGTIIGVVIGSMFTSLVAVITIFFKDYFIPVLTEKRARSTQKVKTFNQYSNPLIQDGLSYLFRLNEIIFSASQFLLSSTPKNEYNNYKYISTVYRLCVVLGWIRAIRLELSYVQVQNTEDFKKVEEALENFELSLADGSHVEISRAEHLCKIWELKWNSLSENQKKELGSEIELLFDSYCFESSCDLPKDLTEQNQLELCKEVFDLICRKTQDSELSTDIIKNQLDRAIREMSRIEVWIYKDWQSSIGDLMIKRNTSTGERRYDVMSYPDFEEAFNTSGTPLNKWIFRIQDLFEHLDIRIEDRFDARSNQLRNNYNKAKELIQCFSEISKSEVNLVQRKMGILSKKERASNKK